MKILLDICFTGATQPYSIFFGCIGGVALVLLLFSCSSVPLMQREPLLVEERAPPPRYTMVFIIHGDGGYLYHDPRGKAHKADEETLAGAARVAAQNPHAEVFIFHQKPRKRTLFIFPHRDGKFYYYRHGRLLAEEGYWRNQGASRFDPEVELYHRYRTGEQPRQVKLFLYFGHEIPEFGGAGYDASYSRRTFTVHDLAGGLKRFTHDSAKFDLMVLSTCFSGTPHTIATLAPYTRTIVASPENLHLSYFDLHPFDRLDVGLQNDDVNTFAKNFARQTFDRLAEDLQTTVAVAVYDVDRVQGYLGSVRSVYERTLTALKEQKPESADHCDCAEDSAYVQPGMREGVDLFYRSPRFGRSKHKQNHSGWKCWRLRSDRYSIDQLNN